MASKNKNRYRYHRAVASALSLRGIRLSAYGATDSNDQQISSPIGPIPHARTLAEEVLRSGTSVVQRDLLLPFQVAELFQYESEFLSFQIPHICSPNSSISIPHLPHNYGFKGGLARAILAHLLYKQNGALSWLESSAVRDIDLVRRYGTDRSRDEILLKALNPDDFEHGATIEEIRSVSGYLNSRDLTINEVLIIGDRGYVSALGVLDLIGKVLRPCKYRGGSLSVPRSLAPMTVAKCLRFMSSDLRASPSMEGWMLVGVPYDQEINPFALAVQLRRVLDQDAETPSTIESATEAFLTVCIRSGINFDPSSSPPQQPKEFLAQLLEQIPEGLSFFSETEQRILNKYSGMK